MAARHATLFWHGLQSGTFVKSLPPLLRSACFATWHVWEQASLAQKRADLLQKLGPTAGTMELQRQGLIPDALGRCTFLCPVCRNPTAPDALPLGVAEHSEGLRGFFGSTEGAGVSQADEGGDGGDAGEAFGLEERELQSLRALQRQRARLFEAQQQRVGARVVVRGLG